MRGFLYLPVTDKAAAEAKSSGLMADLQTPATRDDPRTVTKFLFGWSVNPDTSRASILVPPSRARLLSVEDQGNLVVESVAVINGDAKQRTRDGMVVYDDVPRQPAPTRPPSGGGGVRGS